MGTLFFIIFLIIIILILSAIISFVFWQLQLIAFQKKGKWAMLLTWLIQLGLSIWIEYSIVSLFDDTISTLDGGDIGAMIAIGWIMGIPFLILSLSLMINVGTAIGILVNNRKRK